MKKRYLLSALVVGVVVADTHIFHQIDKYASADVESYKKKNRNLSSPESIPLNSLLMEVYRRNRIIVAQAQGDDQKKTQTFETKIKDFYYSLQFGVFKKKENAEKFIQKLPAELRDNVFIYKTESGYYSVRYGLFDNYTLLKEIQKKIPINSIIVKTESAKVLPPEQAKIKKTQEKVVEKKEVAEEKKVEKVSKKERKKETKKTVKAETIAVPEFEEEEEISLFEETRPEIPLYKKIIGTVFFVPIYMLTHRDRGFWGKVEFAYRVENYKDQWTTTKRKTFRQYYELNYGGYVYSKRLLRYTIGGNFAIEDSKIEGTYNSYTIKSKPKGYNISLRFLSASRFPFNIYYQKRTSPQWYTYYDGASYVERTVKSYGINGSLTFNPYSLAYEYTHTKSNSFGIDFKEDRKFDVYYLGMNRSWYNKYLNVYFRRTDETYVQDFLNIGHTRNYSNTVDNVVSTYRWKISDKADFNSDLRYYSSSYSDYRTFNGLMRYNYRPSDRFGLNVGLNFNYGDTRSGTTKAISLNESTYHKLGENFSLSQNTILYHFSGYSGDHSYINSQFNLNYSKSISDKLSVHGGVGGGVLVSTGTDDKVGGNVSVNGGLNKRFDFLNSTFSLSGSISQYRASNQERSTQVSIFESYYAYFTKWLSFTHRINYFYQDSKYYNSISDSFYSTNYNNLQVSNSIDYTRPLGWKGRLSTSVGVDYYTNKATKNRIYPFANMNIEYQITRSMLYNLSLDVHHDTYYKATYGILKSKLKYRYRSVDIRFDFDYYYTDSEVSGVRKNYIATISLVRKF